MNYFENVKAKKEANIYYEGQVSSREILFLDGSRKTLGLVLPGEYEFSTGDREEMEVTGGSGIIRLPDHEFTYKTGDTIHVPAHTTFLFIAKEITDYICSYIPEDAS